MLTDLHVIPGPCNLPLGLLALGNIREGEREGERPYNINLVKIIYHLRIRRALALSV